VGCFVERIASNLCLCLSCCVAQPKFVNTDVLAEAQMSKQHCPSEGEVLGSAVVGLGETCEHDPRTHETHLSWYTAKPIALTQCSAGRGLGVNKGWMAVAATEEVSRLKSSFVIGLVRT
jgi:hypothetical protein